MNTEIIVSTGDHGTQNTKPALIILGDTAEYEAMRITDEKGIEDFLRLQFIGQAAALADGTSHHVKPRTHHDLVKHLEAGMDIIGARHIRTGEHVGQALLTDPFSAAAKNMEGYPSMALAKVVQSFYIRADHRYSKLNPAVRDISNPAGVIFAKAAALASGDGITQELVAKIATDNDNSLKTFAHNGFNRIIAVGNDLVRGHPVKFVSAALTALPIQAAIQGDRMGAPCLG